MTSSMAFQLGASSSSSSPSISPWNHDVFLSFRGEDVRHNFISHLNHALCQSGIKTYIDNNLERGEEISPALFKAIEESQISIIVFSKHYAESKWCLDELLKILDCKERLKQMVLPIFYHVDPSEVRHQKAIFGESFNELGDKLKDNAKMLKWKVALKTVADLSGFPLANFRDDESEFIQKIILWVNPKIVNRTPLSVAKHPIGIESRIRDIYQHLSIKRNDIICVVGIFGTGGIAHGIQRLIDKRLITIILGNDKYVWMDDLLQDMGREIEREKSSKDPRKRSRLWFHKDVREVLEEDTGPNEIEGIVIDLPEGDEEISLHPEAFQHMKRLRVFINRNAHFSCASISLSDKLRVLDWYNYPLPYLPHNFQGKNLIVFRIHDSIIKALGDGFKPKNLTTMAFRSCSYLTEIPDLSSTPNLKELTVIDCNSIVKVHDSVGSLEYLSELDFKGCSKLRILPRSLKLRSLRQLNLGYCSSLRVLPEIECKIESLRELVLNGTAVEELPLSIGNIVGLEQLFLQDCKNLMRLPIALNQLQHLHWLCIGGCTNIVKKMRDDGQSLDFPNDSTAMEDEISNSSNGSNALQVSNLQISCSHSESNFFPLYSFFTMFNSSTSLHSLDLFKSDIVSLPTNFKEFVRLTDLHLLNCHKLEEIAELPPNIRKVYVNGCKSLERFSEVSKILEFNGSHIRSLEEIYMGGCNKMHENLWNDKVQNPLLWKGLYDYDAALFPENQIPNWFKYIHEFLDNEMEKGPDDDARRRGIEEWAIDIEGPHYLEDISGIVLYVVLFFNVAREWQRIIRDVKITSKGSNHVCRVQKQVQLKNMDWKNEGRTGYIVWVGYSNLQPFEQKVLDNLQVQFDLGCSRLEPFYTSCRAKVVYKNETRANRERKMDEANVPNSPQHQLT